MELSKRNILLFLSLLFVIILAFFVGRHNHVKEAYANALYGKVQSLRPIGRGEGYLQVKFEGEKEFNSLCTLYVGSENKDDLQVGDSIYKAKNSKDYQIYRQNGKEKYIFYKTLKIKP